MSLEQRIRQHYTREDHPSVFELLAALKKSEYEWQILRTTCDAHIVVIEDGEKDIAQLRTAIEEAPHDTACPFGGYFVRDGEIHQWDIDVHKALQQGRECDCWKRTALENPNG